MAYTPENPNGQALAANSAPVVLPAAQITALTPPAAITGFALAANQQTNALTDTQLRAIPLSVSGAFFQATQPISGTVTANTGLIQPLTNTEIRLTPLPISGTVITGDLTDSQLRATPVAVTMSNTLALTDTQLRAAAIQVAGIRPNSGATLAIGLNHLTVGGTDGTNLRPLLLDNTGRASVIGTFFQATQPVSIAVNTPDVTDRATRLLGVLSTGTNTIGAVNINGTIPVSGALTDAQIRATPLTVTMVNTLALTDTQIRATPLAVSGPFFQATQPVSGTVTANATLAAETTKVIGRVGIDQTILGTTNAIQSVPGTTNGLTTFNLVSAATTNATIIKASAGQVYGWYIYNSNAAARKITFHNSAAAPTAGAGVFMSLVIPPGSGANVHMTTGISFSTGIGITTTTGLAANDAVAVALNDLVINIFFK